MLDERFKDFYPVTEVNKFKSGAKFISKNFWKATEILSENDRLVMLLSVYKTQMETILMETFSDNPVYILDAMTVIKSLVPDNRTLAKHFDVTTTRIKSVLSKKFFFSLRDLNVTRIVLEFCEPVDAYNILWSLVVDNYTPVDMSKHGEIVITNKYNYPQEMFSHIAYSALPTVTQLADFCALYPVYYDTVYESYKSQLYDHLVEEYGVRPHEIVTVRSTCLRQIVKNFETFKDFAHKTNINKGEYNKIFKNYTYSVKNLDTLAKATGLPVQSLIYSIKLKQLESLMY